MSSWTSPPCPSDPSWRSSSPACTSLWLSVIGQYTVFWLVNTFWLVSTLTVFWLVNTCLLQQEGPRPALLPVLPPPGGMCSDWLMLHVECSDWSILTCRPCWAPTPPRYCKTKNNILTILTKRQYLLHWPIRRQYSWYWPIRRQDSIHIGQ